MLDSLVNNHALIDGNKRLGWVATRLFYGFNGYAISASDDEKFDLVIAVATARTVYGDQDRPSIVCVRRSEVHGPRMPSDPMCTMRP